MPPHSTSWRSILILSFHLFLGPPSGVFLSGLPTKTLYSHLLSPIRATWPANFILLYFSHPFLHSIFCPLFRISSLTKINCLSEKSKFYFVFTQYYIPLLSSPFVFCFFIHANFKHKRQSMFVPTIPVAKK